VTIILTLAALLFGQLFASLFKNLSDRLRPDLFNYLSLTGRDSFPSGHALVSVLFYGFIGYLFFMMAKKTWQKQVVVAGTILIIFLIGLSRLYLGVHWFSDVVGGWLLGGALLILLISIFNHVERALPHAKQGSAIHIRNLVIIFILIIFEAFFITYFYYTHQVGLPPVM
jgi:membrane-associated phospholipid phosphatase